MQICCEGVQLLEPACFPLEGLILVLARVDQKLKLAQQHCLHQPKSGYSWKRKPGPSTGITWSHSELMSDPHLSTAATSASLTQGSPKLCGTGCLCSLSKNISPNFIHGFSDSQNEPVLVNQFFRFHSNKNLQLNFILKHHSQTFASVKSSGDKCCC